MVAEIMDALAQRLDVCVALYGHPGVFVNPSHEAIAAARELGYPARMLPAVSAEDCLIADLGIDPGETGLQTYEATDFLMHRRAVDTTTPLILWQVSMIGAWHTVSEPNVEGVRILAERLVEMYGGGHEVVFYEAASYPVGDAEIVSVRLDALGDTTVTAMATLYVPPVGEPERDAEMTRRLWRSSKER